MMDENISRRSFLKVVGAFGAVLVVGACGSTESTDQDSERTKLRSLRSEQRYKEKEIEIGDNYFSPQEITIDSGTIVIWTNKGSFLHDVMWDDSEKGDVRSDFSSKPLQSKNIHVHLFDKPGKYYYHCHYHGGPQRGQWGSITVQDTKANSPENSDATIASIPSEPEHS